MHGQEGDGYISATAQQYTWLCCGLYLPYAVLLVALSPHTCAPIPFPLTLYHTLHVQETPTGSRGRTPAASGAGTTTHGILRLRTEDAEVQNSLVEDERAPVGAPRVHWATDSGGEEADDEGVTHTRSTPQGGGMRSTRLQQHATVEAASELSPSTLRAIAVALAHEEAEVQTTMPRERGGGRGGAGAAALPTAAYVPVPTGSALEAVATGLDADILSAARAGLLLDRVIPVTPHPVPLSAARLAEMIMIHTIKAAHFDWGYAQPAVDRQACERARRAAAADARIADRGQTTGQETQESGVGEEDTEALLPPQEHVLPEAGVEGVQQGNMSRPRRSLWSRWFRRRHRGTEDEDTHQEAAEENTAATIAPTPSASQFGRVLDPSTVPVAAIVRPPPSPGRPFTLPLGAITTIPLPAAIPGEGEEAGEEGDMRDMGDTRPPPRRFRRIRLWWRGGGRRTVSIVLLTVLMVAAIAAAPVGGLFIAANVALGIAGIAAFTGAARGMRRRGQEGGQAGVPPGVDGTAYPGLGMAGGQAGDSNVPDAPLPPEEADAAMARLHAQQQQQGPVRSRRQWSMWGRSARHERT